MATHAQEKLTYGDVVALDDDNVFRELIDGELCVTPSPGSSHQAVVIRLATRLQLHAEEHGGVASVSPHDVYFDESNVVQPDVLFIVAGHADRIEDPFVRGAPDVVVEVSSPSTRHRELVRKRELYARFGVPEYWYVDRDTEEIYVDRLHEGRYSETRTYRRGDVLESPEIPGFSIEVDYLLGPET